jgi:hypothetical protein
MPSGSRNGGNGCRYFEVVTGSALTPGGIPAIQTFGARINLHVHLHFLVTEGGVDEACVFHKITRIDDSRLAEIFAREVLAMLVRKELLSPEWAEDWGASSMPGGGIQRQGREFNMPWKKKMLIL